MPRARLGGESLEPRLMLDAVAGNGDPVISELMAVNDATLADEDGDFPDWIELHNPTDAPVGLDGWHLTDEAGVLDKWHLPDVSLGPGEFLVVFASGKDRADPASELHTNFQISSGGEFLALTRPDGTIAHGFDPGFPPQYADISYGISQQVTVTPLVGPGTPARVLVPGDGSLGSTWTGSAEPFDDGGWPAGTADVGYDTEQVGQPTNIAPTGTASQSSSYSASYPASRALDGNLDNFTHTANQADSYWRLALPEPRHLGSIVLWNRASCCAGRLSNFRLSVFDESMTETYGEDFFTPEQGGGNVGLGESFSVELPPDVWGQTVQVQFIGLNNDGNGYLSLAEVEIYESPGYVGLFGTDLLDRMNGINASAYVRAAFDVADPAEFELLHLGVRYDDGFTAYVNGQEVARRNAPASPAWNSTAPEDRPDAEAVVVEQINISGHLGALRPGNNLLAVQGLNSAPDDADFLLVPELSGTAATSQGVYYFFDAPTPGEYNAEGFAGFVADTRFSVDRGFFQAPFSTRITTQTPGAAIRYTTDGTMPTETHGTLYAGPIPISTTTTLRAAAYKAGFRPTNVDTQTYIFPQDVIRQPANPPGFPGVWDGVAQSPISADYAMDPEVVDSPAYRDEIVDGLKSIPTISIVMDPADLFGSQRGIYINSGQRGRDWEHPTSVEIIQPDGSSFQTDSGIRIHGYSWRYHSNTPKHSFRLEFRDQYGPNRLEYPLFPDAPVDRFDSIVLRAQGGRAWAGRQAPQQAQYLRDTYARDTARDMGAFDGHATLVHLYLNGLYWGLYNPVERPEAQMGEEYFGGSEDDYDALNRRTSTNEVIDGDIVRYYEMTNLADAALAAGVTTDGDYAELQRYLAMDDFIDWILRNQYVTNRDGLSAFDGNNQRAIGSRVGEPQFRFFVWDMEYSMWNATDNNNVAPGMNSPPLAGSQNPPRSAWKVYNALRQHPEFRLRYADRVQMHMFNDGALTPGPAAARWQARADSIYTAIIGESARWGDAKRSTPYTRDVEWTAERNRLVTQYFPRRTDVLLGQLRSVGLYPGVAAATFNQRGGDVPPGFGLVLSAPAGEVYYTLDGTDPRLPGGAIHGTRYTGPITLNESVQVRARVLDGTTWSALDEAEFRVHGLPVSRDLVVTELNYNPHAPTAAEEALGFDDNEDFEFIELANVGDQTLDLTGVRLDGGVQFEFTGTHQGVPVLIAEAGTGAPDFIEIQNVSAGTVATNGWVVAANDATNSRINDVHPILWTLPATMAAGELGYRPDTPQDDIFWRTDGNGWAMLLDDQGSVADFVVWGYSDAEIASLDVTVNGFEHVTVSSAWSGPAVPAGGSGIPPNSLQRAGNSDHDDASDWAFAAPPSPDGPNPGLATPFAGVPPRLRPGELVVVAANVAAFKARYGDAVDPAGQYTARLANGGERITLIGPADRVLLDFRYGDSNDRGWPELPDGGGCSLVIVDPQGNYDDPDNWRRSTRYGGTPGTGPVQIGVVINEVLSHSDQPLTDAIELHNTTADPIDIGGWWLSDSSDDDRKFQIPADTTIPGGGYVVFYEGHYVDGVMEFDADEFGGSGQQDFALDGAAGDDVWLTVYESQEPAYLVDRVEFGAAVAGESFGRWTNAPGNVFFYPMISRTLDPPGPNSGPRVGPELIVSELMYHQADPGPGVDPDDLEFIEIYNTTSRPVVLTDWRLRRGLDFDFAAGTTLGPKQALVVVRFDPDVRPDKEAEFRSHYGIDASVQILGGHNDRLDNDRDRVQLQDRDEPVPLGDPPLWLTPHPLEDEVDYRDTWQPGTDGGGDSLNRVGSGRWGHEPDSWIAAAPTPGTVELTPEVAGRHVFYNRSSFDGMDAAADQRDDQAIAPDKKALLPGQTATFANYTSYALGLNGLMVDVLDLKDPAAIGPDDFRFAVGNDDDPSGWSAVPVAPVVSVRSDAGRLGSDRITLVWPDGAVAKQWLEVTLLANHHTGLAAADVFYFGNAIAESGNSTSDAKVGAIDMLGARDNQRNFLNPAPLDFAYDFNRDARVNSVDMLIARNNQTHFLNALRLITVPAAGPPPAEAAKGEARQEDSPDSWAWLHDFQQPARQKRRPGTVTHPLSHS